MSINRVETDLAISNVDPMSGRLSAAANVSVQINARNDDGTNGALATVYATPNTGTTLTNPLTTDNTGRIYGWVPQGSYNLNVSGANVASTTLSWEAVPSSAVGISTVFGRSGPAITAQTGDYTAAQVTNAADKSSASQQTFTGNVASPIVISSAGTTGAPNQVRLVGATVSGAPTSGTFLIDDVVIDQQGNTWICTAGGTPGTWKSSSNTGTVFAPIEVPGTSTTATSVANTIYVVGLSVFWPTTLTGLRIRNSTLSGNILVSLYDVSGNLLASSGSTAISSTWQAVPFSSTYTAIPGRYHIGAQFSSAITINIQSNWNSSASAAQGSFVVPSTITVPTTFGTVVVPQMSTY